MIGKLGKQKIRDFLCQYDSDSPEKNNYILVYPSYRMSYIVYILDRFGVWWSDRQATD